MSQHASAHRARFQLECLEDRCTPSTLLNHPWVFPADHGGSQAAQFESHRATPDAMAAAPLAGARGHAIPITLTYQCFADLGSFEASAKGFATGLGHWTSQGQIDEADVDLAKDRAEIHGAITVVTASGDKLFVSFTASWEISSGKGTKLITVTGGTGRFAGASGDAIMECTVTSDLASQTFACDCQGSGTLILVHR
jgi:hypothetical protein